jgi:hypothetical protein
MMATEKTPKGWRFANVFCKIFFACKIGYIINFHIIHSTYNIKTQEKILHPSIPGAQALLNFFINVIVIC